MIRQSKQKQIMVELYFSTIHDHVKMLDIKLGTICALKDLVFVTGQSLLTVRSSSEHISLKMFSMVSFSFARAAQQSS